jgi:hypothetical protein
MPICKTSLHGLRIDPLQPLVLGLDGDVPLTVEDFIYMMAKYLFKDDFSPVFLSGLRNLISKDLLEDCTPIHVDHEAFDDIMCGCWVIFDTLGIATRARQRCLELEITYLAAASMWHDVLLLFKFEKHDYHF